MEHIEYFDLIHSNPNKRRDVVNEEWTIYDAYESSVAASSSILNFYKIINDNEVPKLVELMEFCKADCIITGMVEIPTQNISQSKEKIPAISLAVHY